MTTKQEIIDYIGDPNKFDFGINKLIDMINDLKPTIKKLEWHDNKGFLCANTSNNNLYCIRYRLNVRVMTILIYKEQQYFEILECEKEYDFRSSITPTQFLKDKAQQHFERQVLEWIE
jgi:hypothetical protein